MLISTLIGVSICCDKLLFNCLQMVMFAGSSQPGCGLDIGGLCSHNIVEDFFEASINPANRFTARQCGSFAAIRFRTCVTSGPARRMGGEPVMDGASSPRTVFFLETNARSPFAQG